MEHEHKGLDGYAYHPGTVDKNSGPQQEKDESASPSGILRQPVRPERGRPEGAPSHPGSGE